MEMGNHNKFTRGCQIHRVEAVSLNHQSHIRAQTRGLGFTRGECTFSWVTEGKVYLCAPRTPAGQRGCIMEGKRFKQIYKVMVLSLQRSQAGGFIYGNAR